VTVVDVPSEQHKQGQVGERLPTTRSFVELGGGDRYGCRRAAMALHVEMQFPQILREGRLQAGVGGDHLTLLSNV
jgi:hypothetical protein